MPKIFLISSPSGGGEDSVIEGLKKHLAFRRVITTVTRKKLPGEKNGKPYYFVSTQKFKKLIRDKKMIEWARVYGDYRGCTRQEIQKLLKQKLPIIWKLDWQGVKTVKKLFPGAVSFFIVPPSYKVLEKRLVRRGRDSLKEIKQREKFTKIWLQKKHLYDYRVVNKEGMLNQTITKIVKIMKSKMNA